MSPKAGITLVQEVAPRLWATVPKSVPRIGAEDVEELVQDGLAIAAQLLESAEARGKEVTAGNIAYYTIRHLRSGSRSWSRSRTDAMAPGTQLEHRSSVLSDETEVGTDPEIGEPVHLGEMLAQDEDDPSEVAARNLDWETFLDTHDYRYRLLATALAGGETMSSAGRRCGLSNSGMTGIKQRMAEDLRSFFGCDPIRDSLRKPAWKQDIAVERERAACRADSRHAKA